MSSLTISPRRSRDFLARRRRCVDRAGHTVIEVTLCDKYAAFGLSPRTAHVHLRVEAPEIDGFVRSLLNLRLELGSTVTLSGAT
jgi:hypothetical protein